MPSQFSFSQKKTQRQQMPLLPFGLFQLPFEKIGRVQNVIKKGGRYSKLVILFDPFELHFLFGKIRILYRVT